jgi:polyribonucleotide nucleotidyltransferase
MSKMTKQELEEWNDLYEYVKKDILKYDEKLVLPKNLVLRLKGLKDGKFIANKKTKALGDYSFKIILMTFKINKYEIINAINDKSKFKDENHMINYLMAIVEKKINDTYSRLNRLEQSQEKGENLEITTSENKAEYKHKTKEVKNSRLKELL